MTEPKLTIISYYDKLRSPSVKPFACIILQVHPAFLQKGAQRSSQLVLEGKWGVFLCSLYLLSPPAEVIWSNHLYIVDLVTCKLQWDKPGLSWISALEFEPKSKTYIFAALSYRSMSYLLLFSDWSRMFHCQNLKRTTAVMVKKA